MPNIANSAAETAAATAEPYFPRSKMSFPLRETIVFGAKEYCQDFADFATWKLISGEAEWREPSLSLSDAPAELLFTAYPHRRVGGNVRLAFEITLESVNTDAFLQVRVNDFAKNLAGSWNDQGTPMLAMADIFSYTPEDGCKVTLQDITVPVSFVPEPGNPFTLEFITAAPYKELRLNGERVAGRWVHTPWVCSEGEVSLKLAGMSLTLSKFTITEAEFARPETRFKTGELLFADDLTDGKAANWVYEFKDRPGLHAPDVRDGWLHIDKLAAAWCRFRTEEPAVTSFEMRPVPKTPDTPHDITDAIFFLNTGWANGPEDFFCEPHYDPGVSVYNDIHGYWFDVGGNDNKTTRLRRLPYRQLLRQNSRPEAILKPAQIHHVEVLCARELIEMRLDGCRVLRAIDPNPYTAGHFGVLGFVRPLQIRNLQVHRAVTEA